MSILLLLSGLYVALARCKLIDCDHPSDYSVIISVQHMRPSTPGECPPMLIYVRHSILTNTILPLGQLPIPPVSCSLRTPQLSL